MLQELVVYKCRADRLTWIFSTLKRIIHSKGESFVVGAHATMEGEFGGIKFTAFSIVLKVKSNNTVLYAHLLSTKHNWSEISVSDITTVHLEEKDTSTTTERSGSTFGGVLRSYNIIAPFIDRVNNRICNALPLYRWTRWKSKHLLYVILFMIHNSFQLLKVIVKQFAGSIPDEFKGVADDTWDQYRNRVMNTLSPITRVHNYMNVEHTTAPLKRCFMKTKSGNPVKQLRCCFCKSNPLSAKIAKTCHYCLACQSSICSNCFTNLNAHINGMLTPTVRKNMYESKFVENISYF